MFPLSNITIFYWFFFYPGVFEISSILLILFQILQNIGFEVAGSGGVAYLAHLCGYTYGFLVGMGLLSSGLLIREPYDVFSMYSQYRRRRDFRQLTRSGYRPWELDRNAAPPPGMVNPDGNFGAGLGAQDQQLLAMRSQISQALASQNLGHAAELYGQLLEIDPSQVLGRQQQLDIANQLLTMGRHELSARAMSCSSTRIATTRSARGD